MQEVKIMRIDVLGVGFDNLTMAEAVAREIVKDCGWTVIHCARDGEPRTVEDIHGEVYRTVKNLL